MEDWVRERSLFTAGGEWRIGSGSDHCLWQGEWRIGLGSNHYLQQGEWRIGSGSDHCLRQGGMEDWVRERSLFMAGGNGGLG